MIKNLIKHGNSAALVIDKPIMELLNITDTTPLEITTDGKSLVISPIQTDVPQKNILESLQRINKKYSKALQKLGE
ncbi:MAG TPA: AbrB/MazE/SpoVT family DNA-binding domain-containing protein [Treponemataceae bacterium]|jgi:antitoxin component of MazEF toxin-antitoxin module|nr:AbrB/MazE/SpoVT family DNA-binding domain-containing protein [Treponemataceae bacterium]